jgi:hypothetical protein
LLGKPLGKRYATVMSKHPTIQRPPHRYSLPERVSTSFDTVVTTVIGLPPEKK